MKFDLFRAAFRGRAFGALFNARAIWIGLHGSNRNKRVCFNLIPCVTLWFAARGGVQP